MRAVRVRDFGGPEVLRVEETADPTTNAGQVLVRVHAAGVNPADTYVRSGQYANLPQLPYTPGQDGAGVVVAIGQGVSRVAVGDRVFFCGTLTGAYAGLALCDATRVFPLPESVSFAQGAAVGVPYGTAYRALFHKARATAPEWVLVHGASGGVGLGAVQLAVAAGLRVIGTAGSEAGLALVKAQGAHHVLDHGSTGYSDTIRALTEGHGVDVVIESAAHANLQRDLEMMALGGRVVVVGNRSETQVNLRAGMTTDAVIMPFLLTNMNASDFANTYASLSAGLRNGTLRPIVATELPLDQAAQAHRDVMAGKALGKIVLACA